MLTVNRIETSGWEAAIRGMRNPLNSWEKSDSRYMAADGIFTILPSYSIGKNDMELMEKLVAAGPDHSKFMRMIHIQMDITAPMYWWKEFDTYRVGVVPNPTDIEYNSTSTMHKIMHKKFGREDFSTEHLYPKMLEALDRTIGIMNVARDQWLYHSGNFYEGTKSKDWWWQVIQLLPSSYNYLRTIDLNYQAARHIYQSRRNHKLDEWKQLCEILAKGLPCSRLITSDFADAERTQ